jgi:predicted O-methyltransferase YrrM
MNIENALIVQGWMSEDDLRWLALEATTHCRIAEIGCWRGRSTTCLADNTPGVVYAIDHWQGSEEHQPVDADKLYEMFMDTMGPYIQSGKVIPIHRDSLDAAATLAGLGITFDMIFVDASHDYNSIRADILAWRPLLAPGGLFCGHDAGHPPIMRALAELLPDRAPNECSMWVVRT